MHIIIFAHPDFVKHQSMPRYAKMLADGLGLKGHITSIWSPTPLFFKLGFNNSVKKWLGYLDQYLIFPFIVKKRLKKCQRDTLFVFSDHALGPWVPLVKDRYHCIHCHDFLAQLSAIDKLDENKLSWTGKKYQEYIRKGFTKGRHFVSISNKTKQDLHKFLIEEPITSEVVYNGLNQDYPKLDKNQSKNKLIAETGIDLFNGYLLHVGGNQFYKNRIGVIEIYDAWRASSNTPIPLLLIGEVPDKQLLLRHATSAYKENIHFLSKKNDEFVRTAYAGAILLLYPSLAEGFGWPIAEAMASRCPVITTNEAPMTEVAGNAAFLIPKKPTHNTSVANWAESGSKAIDTINNYSDEYREIIIAKGLANAKRFDTNQMLNKVEAIYKNIVSSID